MVDTEIIFIGAQNAGERANKPRSVIPPSKAQVPRPRPSATFALQTDDLRKRELEARRALTNTTTG